jgi:2-polyprenyl-6-methoxyphenol hydroxylase-like FAD-dependent oxidoreductase
MTTTHYDAIIAGAGPVGPFLACELAPARCSVPVLEKAAQPDSTLKRLPFGLRGAVGAQHRGATSARSAGRPRVAQTGRAIRAPDRAFRGNPVSSRRRRRICWPRWRNWKPCWRAARRDPAGLAVTNVTQSAHDVTVHAGGQSFTGRWLVGCDGARSAVRKSSGFEFAGTEPAFTGYTVKVDRAGPGQLKPGRNRTPDGTYVQSQPG